MKLSGSQKIARQLAAEIADGAIPVGQLLQTRTALMTRFGVARATVDRAVQELVRRGLVESRRGAGSTVVCSTVQKRIAVIGRMQGTAVAPELPGVDLQWINPSVLCQASNREQLRCYDGLLWCLPGSDEMKWACEHAALLPQMVINRAPSDLNYVSTDHAGAYYQIMRERLLLHPKGTPVFLEPDEQAATEVIRLRREGFVRACREAQVFYEVIALPERFDEKCAAVAAQLVVPDDAPLLICSGSLGNTGAVMRWVTDQGLQWGRDLLYSDFDNDYPVNVWGFQVTSFLQDYAGMWTLALKGLVDLIGGVTESIQVLMPPLRRDGET